MPAAFLAGGNQSRHPHEGHCRTLWVADTHAPAAHSAGVLSPAIVGTILNERQPEGLTLTQLVTSDIPLDWDEQWTTLGFKAAP